LGLGDKVVKKVKKKKIKLLPCIIFIILLGFFYLGIKYYLSIPLKGIIVSGNTLLNDQEIIDEAKLDTYPKYYNFKIKDIEKKLENNLYIKEVEVKRSFFHIIEIKVVEHKILLYDYASNKYILSDSSKVSTNKFKNEGYPTLVNYVSDEVYNRFIMLLNKIKPNILNQISEIKYEPTKYDSGRFLLTMNDGNYVYINLTKQKNSKVYNIEYLNYYNDFYPNFDGHIGILYLDSGYGSASEYKILK